MVHSHSRAYICCVVFWEDGSTDIFNLYTRTVTRFSLRTKNNTSTKQNSIPGTILFVSTCFSPAELMRRKYNGEYNKNMIAPKNMYSGLYIPWCPSPPPQSPVLRFLRIRLSYRLITAKNMFVEITAEVLDTITSRAFVNRLF